MTPNPLLPFPTALHAQVSESIVDFFRAGSLAQAVLLVNSCARGVATPDSDLDVAVLVPAWLEPTERATLEAAWLEHARTQAVFEHFQRSGRFTRVHLDLIDGTYLPGMWDDGGGPDGFELELGNQVAHSVVLWQTSDAFERLRATWLPYYDDTLRTQRLKMAREACAYDLEHVAFFVERQLYFQAFDRLYKAFQEFLQALCISRRTYPIAYNKWIRELVEVRLNLPELYPQLPPLLALGRLEGDELVERAERLKHLLERWVW